MSASDEAMFVATTGSTVLAEVAAATVFLVFEVEVLASGVLLLPS